MTAKAISDIAMQDIDAWLAENHYTFRLTPQLIDNYGSSEIAIQNTQEFNERGIDIILGHPWSSQSSASLPYVNENDMLMLSSSSTSPRLETDDNLLRVCPSDSFITDTITDFYEEKGVKAVAFLYIDTGYINWMIQAIEEACGDDIQIISHTSYSPGETDFSEYLQEVDESIQEYLEHNTLEIDEIILQMLDYGEIASALEQVGQSEYQIINRIHWYGTPDTSIDHETLMRIGDQAALHKLFRANVAIDTDAPEYQSVNTRFIEATGRELGFYDAVNYDSYWLLVHAIIEAGSSEALEVRDAILNLYSEPPPLLEPMISVSSLLSSVIGQSSDPYNGISGDISFNEIGDRSGVDYELKGFAWIDEQIEEVVYASYNESTEEIETYTVEESPPQFVTIGVTAVNDDALSETYNIVGLAKSDINQDMADRRINVWFDFLVLNNENSMSQALSNVQIFDSMGINLIAGHDWSSQANASLDYVNQNDMLLFSSSSTLPYLAVDDNLLRLTTTDAFTAKVIAELYQEKGIQATIIYQRADIWGDSITQALIDECVSRGITVLGSLRYDVGNWDVYSDLIEIQSVIDESPFSSDEIAFQLNSFWEIPEVLRQASDDVPNLLNVKWFGSDGTARNQDILDEMPVEGLKVKLYSPFVAPIYDDPLYLDFVYRYEALGEEANYYTCAKYDILRLFAEAIANTETTDTVLIKAELESLVINYHGVSGYTTFNEFGDKASADFDIWSYGWENNEPSIIRSGAYDYETNTITLFSEEPPGELFYFISDNVRTSIAYHQDDPSQVELRLNFQVQILSFDGFDSLEYVKVTDPCGYEVYLEDAYFQSSTVEYDDRIDVEEPITGVFTFEAKFGETIIYDSFWLGEVDDPWDFNPITSVFPQNGVSYDTSENLIFNWESDMPDQHWYDVSLNQQDGEMHWDTGDEELPLYYDGEPLPNGLYDYDLRTYSERQEVLVEGRFIIGPELQLYGTRVRSYTTYYTSDLENDVQYELGFETSIINLQNTDLSVSVLLPDGSSLQLFKDDENRWENSVELSEPVSGDFVFTVTTQGEEFDQRNIYFDEWVLTPFDYVTPSTDEIIPDSGQLVFTWDTPLSNVDSFGIGIWSEDEDILWNDEIEESPWEYDGPELEEGGYEFGLVAWIGNGEIHAKSRFFIGSQPFIVDTHIWSNTWYYLDNPNDINYGIGVRTTLLVDNYDDVDYVKVSFPEGEIYYLEEGWSEEEPWNYGEYRLDLDLDAPVYGDFLLEASYQGTTKTMTLSYHGWIETVFDSVLPMPGTIFQTSEDLEFSWTTSLENIDTFGAYIWGNGYDWEDETSETSLSYSGDPLPDGDYNFEIWARTPEGGHLYAYGNFLIG